jgi:hypothetical protein
MEKTTIKGQPSWRIANDCVEAFVTEKGAHIAPVNFDLGGRKVQPYMVAPWAEEKFDTTFDEVLKVLRGDFFCLPFSGKFFPPDGIAYPPHGETATENWQIESSTDSSVTLAMDMKLRNAKVQRSLNLVNGHRAIYTRNVVTGLTGPMSYGMHPTLQLPDEEGCGLVSVAPFDLGEVFPFPFEIAAEGGYQCLRPGATFTDLTKVPQLDGGFADLTSYPARKGYEDFVMLRTKQDLPFGWTAVVVPSKGYIWFSLKDPKVLPLSLLWMSNRGRHYAPWSSRNIGVLGVEEGYLMLPLGPAETSTELFSNCAQLSADKPLVVKTIMAVAPCDASFGRVADIVAVGDGVELADINGQRISAKVDLSFVK